MQAESESRIALYPELDNTPRARGRLLAYYSLCVSLAALVVLLPFFDLSGDTDLDSAIEVCAGICALLGGTLLLTRFGGLRDPSFALVFGAGLICSGIFETSQLLLWRTQLGALHYSPYETVSPWYWTTERLTFSVLWLAALLASKRAQIIGPDNGITPRLVVIGTVGLTIPIWVYLMTSPVPEIATGEAPVRRPIELIPIGFLIAAYWLMFRDGRWRQLNLAHWLMMSLPFHIGGEVLVVVHGGESGSAALTCAHILRLAGHAVTLIGISRTTASLAMGRDTPREPLPPSGLLRFGTRGIGFRLLLMFGTMIAGVVLLTALNDYWVERDALIASNKRHLNSIASAQRNAIESMLAQYRAEAALVSNRKRLRYLLNGIGSNTPIDKKRSIVADIEKNLADVRSAMPRSPGMALFDSAGRLVTQLSDIPIDSGLRELAALTKVPWRTDIVFSAGTPILVVNSPITYEQRRVGNLLLLFSTAELYAQLHSHAELGDSTEALLGRIGENGEVELISPLIYRPQFRNRPVVPPKDLASSMARAIVGIEGVEKRRLRDYRDKPVIATTRQISSVRWGLLVKIDEPEVLADISALAEHHVRNGVAILLFALVVAYVLITVFLAPLQRLVRYTEKITDGQYSFRLHNLTHDEIGQLGNTLNNMAESIEQRTSDLEEKSLRIETIVETMVDGLIVSDARGRIEAVNAAACKLFGYSRDELIGCSIDVLMPDPYRSRHQGYMNRYVNSAEKKVVGMSRELTAERKDGSLFTIELSLAELSYADKTRFTAIIRDVTERLAAEQLMAEQNASLIQANEDLEQFAYIASHDLKSPLRAVDNLVQWIEEDLGDELAEAAATNMTRLKERVRRMESMIQDLLEYSRAGRRDAEPETIDCSALINGIVLDLDPPAGMKVEFDQLPTIDTPRAALETVLRNLIANAINHHDRAEGSITVQAQESGDYLSFTVEDDGPGIPERFHSKIFQIFQSLAAKSENSGTGMGLALVKRLVQAGGGHIQVQSSDQHRGTRFAFLWPRSWPRQEPGSDSDEHRYTG